MTGGVAPSLAQSSMTSGVYPSLAQEPTFSGGTPYLAQPSLANRVASSPAQSLATRGVAPSLAQASRVGGVTPCLAKRSVTSGVAPSLGQTPRVGGAAPSLAPPSMIIGMAPGQGHASLTIGMAPGLGHPSLTIGVAPGLAQPSFASGMAPSLGQPPTDCTDAPSLGQPSMASGVFSSLAQPSVAGRGPPSLVQPPMISGTGCTLSQPSWSPRAGSNPPWSRVKAEAPSLHHSSFAFEVRSRTPYPSVANGRGRGLSQPTVSTRVDPHQDPLTVRGVTSGPQAPEFSEVSLGFHQPPGVSGRLSDITEQSAVTLSTPNLYQAPAASGKGPCLGREASIAQGVLFGSVATSMSPGATAAGMFLSMSRVPVSPGGTGSMGRRSVATGMSPNQSQAARGASPVTSRASVAGVPLTHEPASGSGPGFSWASRPSGLGKGSSRFSLAGVGPSAQVKVGLPVHLDYQRPGSISSYAPTHTVIQEPGTGLAGAAVPGSTANRMTATMAPGTAAGGVAPSLSPRSAGRGVGQCLPPGPMTSCVAPSFSPGYVVDAVVPTLPLGSVIGGVGQGLPPGSVIGGVGQGLPLAPMTSPAAQSLTPGSEASGKARTLPLSSVGTGVSPGLLAASEGSGKNQASSVRPSARLTAPKLLPGPAAGGVGPGIPVASNVVPASTPGGLNQSLALEPMAGETGSPSATGYVAQSLPQGSLLIGLTPRLYLGAPAGEGPTASFQAPPDLGPAQVRPQALEASGTAKGVPHVPTVLQRASQLSQALGMMPLETIGGRCVKKSEDPDKSQPQGYLTRMESEILEATPWLYHSPLATDVDYSQEFPAKDEALAKGQRPLLEEITPGQAKAVTSGMASVPPQSPSFAKHSVASDGSPTLQQRSATSWRVPSSHAVPASGVPDVQMETVKGAGAPLAQQQVSVPPAAPQRSLVAPVVPQKTSAYQKSLVAHIAPQHHSPKTMASAAVSGSPQLARSDAAAPNPHQGSAAGIGTPSTPQRSGPASVVSQLPLHPSLARGAGAGGFQKEAVPSALQKPVSRGPIQKGHRSLGPRKSYRAIHDIPASQTPPSSSEAQPAPPHREREGAPGSSPEVPSHAMGAVPAITPIICTGEAAQGTAIARPNLGVHRVSLGYESSPRGSRRPLFGHELPLASQDSLSGRAPADSFQTSLTPTVLQGSEDAGVSRGQAWNSTMVPGGVWEPSRGTVPWEATGRKAAAEPSQPGELVASVQAVEKMVIRAVVIIQACTRGYLVRRAIKVWHQWAVIIQAAWRGYCVRRDMIQLCRAATIIQASWRGFRVRRSHAQQMLLPAVWAVLGGGGGGGGARSSSDHRCFQSCQPRACSLCQSLSSGLGSPPSVVMLVGSSPRTCHTCGHTLPTRVVQGTGRGAVVQASTPRGCSVRPTFRTARQPPRRSQAATTIQSAWRGFRVRRQLKQQQVAAKMLQASWRGHCTRASLTTDALLGPAAWDNSRHTQWPGV